MSLTRFLSRRSPCRLVTSKLCSSPCVKSTIKKKIEKNKSRCLRDVIVYSWIPPLFFSLSMFSVCLSVSLYLSLVCLSVCLSLSVSRSLRPNPPDFYYVYVHIPFQFSAIFHREKKKKKKKEGIRKSLSYFFPPG